MTVSTSTTSGFFEYYKTLDQEMEQIGTPTKPSHDKIYDLMKKNLETISLFSGKLKEGFFSFSNDGTIVVDRWHARGFRTAIKSHFFQYSKYSDDVRRDLVKFTEFVNSYLKTHGNQIERQKALILQTMLKQAVGHLEELQKSYDTQGLKDEAKSIVQSKAKLTKALSVLTATLEKTKELKVSQKTQNYIEIIKNSSDLSDKDKIILLKSKLDSLKTIPVLIDQNILDEQAGIIKENEDKIKDINDQIDALLKSTDISPKERMQKIEELSLEKKKIQSGKAYNNAKEMIYSHKACVQEYTEQYESVFEKNPYHAYKEFINSLNCYKNPEDRGYLLASLLLRRPKIEDLEELNKSLAEIEKTADTRMPTEIKKLQREILRQNEIFSDALSLIKERKQTKKTALEGVVAEETKGWVLGKAAANFISAGGIVTLAFFFPYASVGIPYVPGLVKNGVQGIRKAWNGKTQVEQNAIKEDIKKFIQAIREDPAKAIEASQLQYKTKGTQGRDVMIVVNQFVEFAKNPANEDSINRFMVS